MFKTLPVAAAVALFAIGGQAVAQTSLFSTHTPGATSVAPLPANSPLEMTAPFVLSSPNFVQTVIANRANQNALLPGSNSGNWDMIDTNRTGPDAGRYLFMPFETGTGGVQRVDLWDNNYSTRTVTIVAPGTQGFVSGDASRWTPWGSYLTAEESWGTNSSKGRLFEVTNATTAAANGGTFISRNVIPRVSHEGLAFDAAKSMYFIDELNGGSIYKYVSANPNATTGDQYFNRGQTKTAGAELELASQLGPVRTTLGYSFYAAVGDAVEDYAVPGTSALLAAPQHKLVARLSWEVVSKVIVAPSLVVKWA